MNAASEHDAPHRLTFASASERDTESLGSALAAALEAGSVVALIGNLGAGKTRLVRAIAAAAGVDPREASSPTYVLVHEYAGKRWPIYHFDAYRLPGAEAFLELGAEEYFSSGGVCLIEWADRVAPVLPADVLRISIRTTGDHSREFEITSHGMQSEGVLERMRADGGNPES